MAQSFSADLTFTIETTGSENSVEVTVAKTDSTTTDSEYANITIPASTSYPLGSTTPPSMMGRIITGKYMMISTDTPIYMDLTTATEAIPQITIRDVFVFSGDIKTVVLSSILTTAHVKVVVAGILT